MDLKTFLKENWLLIIGVIISTFFMSSALSYKNKKTNDAAQAVLIANQIEFSKYQSTLTSIEAMSFFVYDVVNGKTLFSKNEHLILPIASIAKLMTGLVALENMSATTTITISKNDIALDANNGVSDGFITGEKWNLKDLLNLSLIISSNGGMHAISSALNAYGEMNGQNIIELMNEKANILGLKDTIFINETGLDIDPNMSGAYSSAFDISMLLKNIIKNNPGLISDTNIVTKKFISESNIAHLASNTNAAINEIPDLLSSKTGFTDLAGGNLAIAFDAGPMHPVVAVVLGSSVNGRFTDMVKLVKISLEKLSE